MASDRITRLLEFYREDPHDPFNIYALALEYLTSDAEEARAHFDRLLDIHPGYLPTYYHAAKLYEARGEKEKAKAIFEKGISLAGKLHDAKAMRELRSAYDELMFD